MSNTDDSNGSNTDSSMSVKMYPSGDTILAMLQNEYTTQGSKKRDIEARTGILIALLGAMVGFYATAVDFSIFKKASSSLEYFGAVLTTLIYIVPFITFILSMRNFIKVFQIKTYKAIGIEEIFSEDAEESKDETVLMLIEAYKSALISNEKADNEKAIQFKNGISFLYYFFIFLIIAFVLKQIISVIL